MTFHHRQVRLSRKGWEKKEEYPGGEEPYRSRIRKRGRKKMEVLIRKVTERPKTTESLPSKNLRAQ